MKTVSVPSRDEVNEKSQAIFDQLKGQLGMVPNIYATIGYSSQALEAFLAYSGAAGDQTFSKKEIEAIKLAVSEANGCDYCQAAHTAIAKMNGFTDEEAYELRKATIGDAKLSALATLAQEVAKNAGHASDEAKQGFFNQGYDEKALIDFIAVVTSVTFTNYVYGLTKVPVDFPAPKEPANA